jgi:hypothetical protein
MEIAQNETIGALLADLQPQRHKPGPRPVARRSGGSRCNCGTCFTCQDNARWERVFNEKFADPDYYQPRTIRRGSSLG